MVSGLLPSASSTLGDEPWRGISFDHGREARMEDAHLRLKQQFHALLNDADLDRMEERERILDAFLATERHVRAQELYEQLRAEGVGVTPALVEEYLRLMVMYGIAHERKFADGQSRYEHCHLGVHHDHLICVNCGEIEEFTSAHLQAMQAQIGVEFGFHAFQHRMEFYGLCERCFAKRPPAIPLTMASVGEKLRVTQIRRGQGVQRRLTSMGLGVGAELEVLNSSGPGPLVVAAGGARFALGFGLAQKVMVAVRPERAAGANAGRKQ